LDPFGSFWIVLDHFGSFWIILDRYLKTFDKTSFQKCHKFSFALIKPLALKKIKNDLKKYQVAECYGFL